MPGLGTLVNVAAIAIGGLIGTLFGKKIPERVSDTIQTGNAVAVLFIGIGGTLQHMLVFEDGHVAIVAAFGFRTLFSNRCQK